MSQLVQQEAGPITMDPYEIGWYIESADEDIYGPLSRRSLRRFLEEKTITPNTLIRHCTQAEAKPAADQPGITAQLSLEGKGSSIGDRLSEAWPRKASSDHQLRAEDSLPCWRHRKPAVLVCLRCHAPYCNKCRAKPFRKQFFLCRRCQMGTWNRRFGALILDYIVFLYLPTIVAGVVVAASGAGTTSLLMINVAQLIGFILIFTRDAIAFKGAGLGKRRQHCSVEAVR